MLNKILDSKKKEIAWQMAQCPLKVMAEMAEKAPATRSFKERLQRENQWPALIAEIKIASPLKGILAPHLDVLETADVYQKEGASSISVLTDKTFFKGSLETLSQVRRVTSVPLLRKDFIIHHYQVFQARAYGADAVLLIVAALGDKIRDFLSLTHELGMDALVEVHNRNELETALDAGASVIGINNRNLETFVTHVETTARLLPHIPPGHRVVSESGIQGAEQARLLGQMGVDAILVGEALVKSDNIAQKVREFVGQRRENIGSS